MFLSHAREILNKGLYLERQILERQGAETNTKTKILKKWTGVFQRIMFRDKGVVENRYRWVLLVLSDHT